MATGEVITKIVQEQESKALKLVPKLHRAKQQRRDGDSYHVTLMTPMEVKQSKRTIKELVQGLEAALQNGFTCLGLGGVAQKKHDAHVYFLVLVCEKVNDFRVSCGMPRKHLHITVGFKDADVHDVAKNSSSLLEESQGWGIVDVSELLDHVKQTRDLDAKLEFCSAVLHHSKFLQREQGIAKLMFKALVERAKVFGLKKLYEKSVRDVALAMDNGNPTPRALLILGDGLQMLDRKDEAKEHYEKALENCTAMKMRSMLLSRLEKLTPVIVEPLKFPRTPHIYNLGAATRDDLLLPEDRFGDFCETPNKDKLVFVEEKVDGANLGIFINEDWKVVAKNRSHYVCAESAVQWTGLDVWIDLHRIELCDILGQRFVLYGEWLYAKHSIHYDNLPSLFLAFDVFDRIAKRFLSVASRDRILAKFRHMNVVPIIRNKPFRIAKGLKADLLEILENTESKFRMDHGHMEGMILRCDEPDHGPDVITFQISRAKLVRGDFIQGIVGHWSKHTLVRNVVRIDPSKMVQQSPQEQRQKPQKYPSTPHLPFSPCVQTDDVHVDPKACDGYADGKTRVVVTEKLDGGNCCLKYGQVFARTHAREATHWSFGPVKELYSRLQMTYPEIFEDEYPNLELFGENMTAIHSITYDLLCGPFYLFAAKSNETWLSWDDVCKIAKHLEIPTVPLVYDGTFENMNQVEQLFRSEAMKLSRCSSELVGEGFVMRKARAFTDREFDRSIVKYVRENHIQTKANWKSTCAKATITMSYHDAKENMRQPISNNKFQLYVDLDGVLADFEKAVLDLTGKTPDAMAVASLWRTLAQAKNFYGSLEWMPGAKNMWLDLVEHDPTILTGVPMSDTRWAEKQKRSWCSSRLGENIPVICCPSRDKAIYSGPKRILIDDRERARRPWEAAGGIFILHKNPQDTIRQFQEIIQRESTQEGGQEEKKTSEKAKTSVKKKDTKKVKPRKPKYKFLMLVGFPGCGKSSLAEKLTGYKRICQDEIGSRDLCESLLGKSIKKGPVVLDRCNVKASDRKRWLDLSMVNKKDAAVVFFDVPAETCCDRVVSRVDHPTIQTDSKISASRIINSFAKQLEKPTTSEGFQDVFVVQTFEQVDALLEKL